ncbi:putative methyltransferase-domain-containing protein [Apodospora peruviana]|uniref:Methyltransferase-domain-containing protein n=1 Tax=Apodospora peruviana TaxID=516989 RepID=A0AAE0MF60_9PEZI|nr:putative methyltransferase-domain-containing protein [Apodospora peruviana]
MTMDALPVVALPHLWQKPASHELLECLKKLRLEPPIWNPKVSRAEILKRREQAATAQDRREIVDFLSAIIKSSLAWIDDDDEREEILEEASKRLSERCGRTGRGKAMGEIIRQWPFERPSYGAFSLTIREPPLTGDSLGLKTWGSSYVLAQLLHQFASGGLAHLLPSNTDPVEVLELGSGTGLLGLAAACVWKADVVLTDLPIIMSNLAHNAYLNRDTIAKCGGRVDSAALTWGGGEEDSDPRFKALNRYQLVIVADPLYDDDHPALLASAIDQQLCFGSDGRALVMVPQRDETTKKLLAALRTELTQQSSPLVCVEESIVAGEDDWDDNADHDDSEPVGFWWGIFKRSMSTQ